MSALITGYKHFKMCYHGTNILYNFSHPVFLNVFGIIFKLMLFYKWRLCSTEHKLILISLMHDHGWVVCHYQMLEISKCVYMYGCNFSKCIHTYIYSLLLGVKQLPALWSEELFSRFWRAVMCWSINC